MCEHALKFRGLFVLPRLLIRAVMLRLLISGFARLAAPCLPFTKNTFLIRHSEKFSSEMVAVIEQSCAFGPLNICPAGFLTIFQANVFLV